jgi:hypothetical protein
MSDANPNPMEKSMVAVLVVANAGGGGRHCCVVCCIVLGNGNLGLTTPMARRGER